MELFSLLVYTGTEAQGKIRKVMRGQDRGAFAAWKWTITAIRHAVMKRAETPPLPLCHGLNVTSESCKIWRADAQGSHCNLVSFSINKDIARESAAGAGGTVDSPSTFGTVMQFMADREGCLAFGDMHWISKFGYEREWLMVPVIKDAGFSFVCLRPGECPDNVMIHADADCGVAETFEEWKGLVVLPTRGTAFSSILAHILGKQGLENAKEIDDLLNCS